MTRALPAGLLLLLLAGCSRGRVELTPLQFRTIDPPAPRAVGFEIQDAIWDEDADGRLRIALRREATVPIVNLRQRLVLSLLLERLPNGKAREYRLTRTSLRGLAEVGPGQARFESIGGIAAVYREDAADEIRCVFRVLAQRSTARLLGGFGKPTRVLLQGEVRARRDARTGAWVTETEQGGFERSGESADQQARG